METETGTKTNRDGDGDGAGTGKRGAAGSTCGTQRHHNPDLRTTQTTHDTPSLAQIDLTSDSEI